MKRVFLSVIGFYWVTTVAVPFLYILLFGFDIPTSVTNEYQFKAAGIMSVVLALAAFFITLSDEKETKLAPTIESHDNYMECAAIFHIAMIYILGGGMTGFLNTVLEGGINGTFYSYVSMFIEVAPLMVIKIFSDKRKGLMFPILIFIIYTLINTSRAGIMYVVMFYVCARAASTKYDTGDIKKRDLYIGIGIIAAPFAFVFASNARGFQFGGIKILMDNIISRLSSLGVLGRAVRAYEKKDYAISLFNEKFSFTRQIELIINAIVPGDIFPGDVMPNQYHRAIFSGYSVEWVRNSYMSINQTLPGYFILKYTLLPALIMSALLIFLMYKVCEKYKNNNFYRVVAITGLWELLYFFDWTMIFVRLERIALTVFLYYEFRQVKEHRCIQLGRIKLTVDKWKGKKICQK